MFHISPGSRAPACGLALASLVLFTSSSAFAYCRTTTCELTETPADPCPRDEAGCSTAGVPTWWPTDCLPYAVQIDGSPKTDLDADQVAELAAEAFGHWKRAECPEGGTPSFDSVFQGFVSCERQETVCGGIEDNVNVILFHDEGWPYGSDAIGMIGPTGSTSSGRLIDADIELNTELFDFSGSEGLIRLQVTLAHEIGHFLGLAHSNEPGALMGAHYNLSSRGEMLSPDDIAGVCAIYPPSTPLTCAPSGGPAYDRCQTDEFAGVSECRIMGPAQRGGCSLSSANSGRTGWHLLALLSLGGAWLRRTRRGTFEQHTTPHS